MFNLILYTVQETFFEPIAFLKPTVGHTPIGHFGFMYHNLKAMMNTLFSH